MKEERSSLSFWSANHAEGFPGRITLPSQPISSDFRSSATAFKGQNGERIRATRAARGRGSAKWRGQTFHIHFVAQKILANTASPRRYHSRYTSTFSFTAAIM